MALKYTHRIHPRSRSIRISVNHQGEVVVTSPRFVSARQIAGFIDKSRPWLEKALAKARQQPVFGVTADWVMIFGKKYRRLVESDSAQPPGVTVQQDKVITNLWSQTTSTKQAPDQKLLTRFLKSTATNYILPRAHQLALVMKTKIGRITLREQKTRWGSCSSQGNLNFNWRLVHCPTAVIDYVIIHELAHRTHMNHSASFWQLVARYDPEYPVHRGWFKRHGLSLD